MIRQVLVSELQRLQDELLAMGSMVQYALIDSVEALQKRDFAKSRQIIADDWQINSRYYDIEQGCVQLIATQQPAAGDVRVLTSMMTISAELERIGDYAKGIGKINLMIGEEALIKPLVDIPRMANKAQSMLHRSLVAFSRRDINLARQIPLEDREVDQYYDQIYRELFTHMFDKPETINQGNYLLWAAHNLERTADRVTNVCERVVYMVTGQIVSLEEEADGLELPVAMSQVEPIQQQSKQS